MTDIDTRSAIRTFIVDSFAFGDEGAVGGDESSLLENGLIDSTDILELIAFLEARFGVTVEDEEVVPQNFDSVSRLEGFVTGKLGMA